MKKTVEVVETETREIARTYCDDCGDIIRENGGDELDGRELRLNPEAIGHSGSFPMEDFRNAKTNGRKWTDRMYGMCHISDEGVAHFCDSCFENRFGGVFDAAN